MKENIAEYLFRLSNLDIKLRVEGERLQCDAPKGVLTPNIQAELVEYKTEILAYLTKGNLASQSAFEPIQPVRQNENLPLSFAQQRLWLLEQMGLVGNAYNWAQNFRLQGILNKNALEQSLTEIVRRHATLRTAFWEVNGKPGQIVLPPSNITVPIKDISQLTPQEQQNKTQQLIKAEIEQQFDLSQGALLRAKLLKLSKSEHILLLTFHHIAGDAQSMRVFVQELSVLYRAFVAGNPTPLPELTVQYTDFAIWQRNLLQSEILVRQLTYWKTQLKETPPLELPIDHPRPTIETFRGAVRRFWISKDVTTALKKLSRQHGATMFMTLLAAFQTLLYRYTGQKLITVGSPITNRNQAEIKGLIGFFVNMLVLCADMDGEPRFTELLTQVRQTALGAYAHQDLPFEKLVEELKPERSLNRNPLFQVIFSWQQQEAMTPELKLSDLEVSPLELDESTVRFELELHMWSAGEGLQGVCYYKTDLFEAETITRLLGHFQTLLSAIAVHPEQQIHQLPILTEVERHQLLIEWNDTFRDYPQQYLHILFERQTAKTPQAIAITFQGQQITYQDLNERANCLAHYLQTLDVGPEALVGIYVERSVEMVVALLGILKAGGAYVALDPVYPAQRLSFIMEDAQIQLVLTQKKLAAKFPKSKPQVVCLDKDWSHIAQQNDNNPVSQIQANNLAYVLFTSGSTGKPKGVAITHKSAVTLIYWAREIYHQEELAGVLASTSICFDLSVFEIFVPLSWGGTIILVENVLQLVDLQASQQITLINTVPSAMRSLIENEHIPASVQTVNLAGEPLSNKLVQQIYAHKTVKKVFNLYGPSEDTTYSTFVLTQKGTSTAPSIGRPIANTNIYLLDTHLRPVPVGVIGQLYIGGDGLAQGYLNRPGLTADRFTPNPFPPSFPLMGGEERGGRLYNTGDLARYLSDGNIEFLGRIDHQVKIRGFRIELGEIETHLLTHAAIYEAVVVVCQDTPNDKRLVAYVVPNQTYDLTKIEQDSPVSPQSWELIPKLRAYLAKRLPDYMIPATFIKLDALPLTPNGKVDRRALPAPDTHRPELKTAFAAPRLPVEKILSDIFTELLNLDQVGIYDNFFDLGANSIQLVQVRAKLKAILDKDVPIIEIFKQPTLHLLARYLESEQDDAPFSQQISVQADKQEGDANNLTEIAIIGMSGRFPGAKNIDLFWQNLINGVESMNTFSDEELLAAGVAPHLLRHPDYVKAGAILEDVDLFDASFFGFSPNEAKITDPQQRLFLEYAYEALENAGYVPETYQGRIGVYGGVSQSTYWQDNLTSNPDLIQSMGSFQAMIGNDKDFLATRVSYKLNLEGPSFTVQTACSTSLVAVSLACDSLLANQSDIVLAGGVTVRLPQNVGYLYERGHILSPDGHCRAFSDKAQGTISSNGVGIVVLKRLQDAMADGDNILAVIKGTALNNDGSLKVGYTAPSVKGQAKVISAAQTRANVPAESITYVETHGTGTPLGDPIEIAALTQAFRVNTQKKQFCAIGSVKTNIGHLDSAAGITGLIKTVLALKHKALPPSLHFEAPNPEIDFKNSPFYVNTTLSEWPTNGTPRRAGVSAFGIGGTNAHVIVEEAPPRQPSGKSRPWQLLLLSAKTSDALDIATKNLGNHLKQQPQINLADVAYTLHMGRKGFDHRRMLVCQHVDDAINALETLDPKGILTGHHQSGKRPLVWMFSGHGTQYINMGLELYQSERVFREHIDLCATLLEPQLGVNLRHILYPDPAHTLEATQQFEQIVFSQPIMFMFEYALARLLMAWGLQPQAMIGHSSGEYVAACLADVFSLEEALALTTLRGQLFQQVPSGAMLTVALSEQAVQPWLNEHVSLALINGPSSCVLSGATEAIDALQTQLVEQDVEHHRISVPVAAHSHLLNPILVSFTEQVEKIELKPPQIPYLSNVTGTWITAEEATDPTYYARHLRQTVRFDDGLQKLLADPQQILLEIGPGKMLSNLAQWHPDKSTAQIVLTSVRRQQDDKSDTEYLVTALGRLWLAGCSVDWPAFYADEERHRLPLPAYPFERQRYWVEAQKQKMAVNGNAGTQSETPSMWKRFWPFSNQQTNTGEIEPEKLVDTTLETKLKVNDKPRTDIERKLVAIWQKLLGVPHLGIHDDFFALGGHSLLATRIIYQIRQVFQVEFPLDKALETLTVADMAQWIEKNDLVENSALLTLSNCILPLQPMQADGTKQPFFCVPPASGSPLCYRDLTLHLGQNQPFYGFQSPGLLDDQNPLRQVEEMAALYVEAMYQVQPVGPYLIGGWSSGGPVAFEMVRLLTQQNKEVALLAMLDSGLLNNKNGHGGRIPLLVMAAVMHQLKLISQIKRPTSYQELRLMAQWIGISLPESFQTIWQRNFLWKLKFLQTLIINIVHSIRIYNLNAWATLNYVPTPYEGQVTLFQAVSKNPQKDNSMVESLQKFAMGGVEQYNISGNHMSIILDKDNTKILAEKLKECLAKIQNSKSLKSSKVKWT